MEIPKLGLGNVQKQPPGIGKLNLGEVQQEDKKPMGIPKLNLGGQPEEKKNFGLDLTKAKII